MRFPLKRQCTHFGVRLLEYIFMFPWWSPRLAVNWLGMLAQHGDKSHFSLPAQPRRGENPGSVELSRGIPCVPNVDKGNPLLHTKKKKNPKKRGAEGFSPFTSIWLQGFQLSSRIQEVLYIKRIEFLPIKTFPWFVFLSQTPPLLQDFFLPSTFLYLPIPSPLYHSKHPLFPPLLCYFYLSLIFLLPGVGYCRKRKENAFLNSPSLKAVGSAGSALLLHRAKTVSEY